MYESCEDLLGMTGSHAFEDLPPWLRIDCRPILRQRIEELLQVQSKCHRLAAIALLNVGGSRTNEYFHKSLYIMNTPSLVQRWCLFEVLARRISCSGIQVWFEVRADDSEHRLSDVKYCINIGLSLSTGLSRICSGGGILQLCFRKRWDTMACGTGVCL
jgi:hypothetical protein